MSHFTVLVPAKDDEHLAEVLQPYHEYECTGIKDQYVIWVDDIHDEYFKQFQNDTVEIVFDNENQPIGTKYCKATKIFWKRSGIGFSSSDKFELPESYELKEMTFKAYYGDFDTFMRDWCGYTDKHPNTGRFGRWTNPNKKWDWWQVGGRWMGILQLKNFESMAHAGDGSPGLMTPPNDNPLIADYALAGDVDWQAMEQYDIEMRLKTYDSIHEALSKFNNMNLDDFKGLYQDFRGGPAEWVEEYFNDNEPRKSLRQEVFPTVLGYIKWIAMEAETWGELHLFFTWDEIKLHLLSRDDFIKSFQARAQTYAFIDTDGNWNQRGEMDWWGMDDKSKGTENYDKAWWDFVHSLPDDLRVYIIDCHI